MVRLFYTIIPAFPIRGRVCAESYAELAQDSLPTSGYSIDVPHDF